MYILIFAYIQGGLKSENIQLLLLLKSDNYISEIIGKCFRQNMQYLKITGQYLYNLEMTQERRSQRIGTPTFYYKFW